MMKRSLIFAIAFYALTLSGFCQTDTLSKEQAKQLLSQLKIDTAGYVANVAADACKCIDSISLTNKNSNEISAEIAKCIDKEAIALQSVIKMYRSMISGEKEIRIDINKNSNEYQSYYFKIERWLRDSCDAMTRAAAANNKESATSASNDPVARKAYDNGVKYLKKEDWEGAVVYFEKAVAADPLFAFAWDNLGICHRKLGNYEEALKAYNKSLEADPKGVTPLHNIPIVYEYQKEYDKALEAYKHIVDIYPDDPEAYYGAGRIYAYMKVDLENALQNMCKAYNAYIALNSPYRVDAEKNINYIYGKMKAEGKEKRFFQILEENHIKSN